MSTDAYMGNVILLYHFEGANNSTTFTEEVGNITSRGGSPVISTADYKYGTSSGLFNGTNQLIKTDDSPLANNILGTSDFTIEMWLKADATQSTGYPAILCNNTGLWTTNGWTVALAHVSYPSNGCLFWCYNYGSSPLLLGSTKIQGTGWTHVAITRSGSNFKLFINGAVDATGTYAGSIDNSGGTNYFKIMGSWDSGNYAKGYLDEVRITKGIARYTATFTPPAEAFPNAGNYDKDRLLMHGNGSNNSTTFTDEAGHTVSYYGSAIISTAQAKFGTASIYLEGTSSYLNAMPAGDCIFGDTWTLEAWFYITDYPASGKSYPIFGYDYDRAYGESLLNITDDHKLHVAQGDGIGMNWNDAIMGTTTVTLATWHHAALSSEAGTVRLFLDGALEGTDTWTVWRTKASPLRIGHVRVPSYSSYQYFKGYLDEIRVSVGIARYTAAFTLPTDAFTLDQADSLADAAPRLLRPAVIPTQFYLSRLGI